MLQPLEPEKKSTQTISSGLLMGLVALVVIVGTGTGYGLSRVMGNNTIMKSGGDVQKVSGDKAAGIVDKKTFKDNSEGVLKEGGIGDEGSFHLERPGGKSQNVYLTSTTVDLSGYIGKKVRVWGQTFQAQEAGWLMDVGLIEVLN